MPSSKARAARVKSQLGVSEGAAHGRLNKNILMMLVKETGRDICFVCEEDIESVEDLSIEHKIPWENKEDATSLFWDLSNIAFSHRSCNMASLQREGFIQRQKLQGTDKSWCATCKQVLPRTQFSKSATAKNGLQWKCKLCCK